MNRRPLAWLFPLALTALVTLPGCDQQIPVAEKAATEKLAEPVIVEHKLGRVVLEHRPQQVAALDMNEADFLDQLGIPIAGMVKDFVPHFLAKYKDDPEVEDLGSIVQPNLERIYALKPDLVLMTPVQATHYQPLAEIAPTLYFDVDFRNSQKQHISVVKEHLLTLGKVFDKEALAQQKAQALDARVAEVRGITQSRPEKALIVLHNNGAFSSFGIQSRFGFIFEALGVKPASTDIESGLHGQPISNEFIHRTDPDILYIVDRTAVMEHRPVMSADQIANPLLRQTRAWKNGHVVLVDADAWYLTAASVTSLMLMMDDVIKGYQG